MFPVQLLTVRKGKNGIARSVLISPDDSDYSATILEIFHRSIGKRREEVDLQMRELELKSQNPKIVKGLALVLERISRFEPPSSLDPVNVRNVIFQRSAFPPVSPEERSGLLKLISVELKTTPEEIIAAMYADKESEQILRSVPEISHSSLSRKFNLEQIETVMLRCSSLTITTALNYQRFVRRLRRLGLLYEDTVIEGKHLLKVSGPVSVLEHSERYGSRLALLLRYITGYSDWEIDAEVMLKSGKDKNSYRYHLDSSVSSYLPQEDFLHNPDGNGSGELIPMKSDKTLIMPDMILEIEGEKVNIVLTRPQYYEDDFMQIENARKLGNSVSLICLIDNDQKCPKGAICLKGEPDEQKIRDLLISQHPEVRIRKINAAVESSPPKEIEKIIKPLDDKIIKHLESLYPDSGNMVEYLDFMGYNPEQALKEAGYSVRWKGLHLVVSK